MIIKQSEGKLQKKNYQEYLSKLCPHKLYKMMIKEEWEGFFSERQISLSKR